MEGLADFLISLLGFLDLVTLSLVLGGVAWGWMVLPVRRRFLAAEQTVLAQGMALLSASAVALALSQLTEVAVRAWLLTQTFESPDSAAFFQTLQFQAGISRALLAAGLAAAGIWLRRRPDSMRRWAAVTFLALLVAASGAWLVHAAGRFEDRLPLMVLTTLHQVGGAVWVGGVAYLAALWHWKRRPELGSLWPTLLSRFSSTIIGVVLLLAGTGTALAWFYVRTVPGLIGTAYGTLVITKMVLLTTALGLAAFNFRAIRRWRRNRVAIEVSTQVPYFIEVETILLLVLLYVATALSSQPPAVDVNAIEQRGTWAEVAEAFRPKWPRLSSASHEAVLAAPSVRSLPPVGSRAAVVSWSEFNHDVSGLFLVAMSVLALVARTKWLPRTRHWPLGFLVLTVFIVIRSDPETWPLGPIGFWEGALANREVLEHRLAAGLALALGIVEWRARLAPKAGTRSAYVFPFVGVLGGMILMSHAHTAFELKSEFLIQIPHTAIGLLAVLMGCGRWLELRLASRAGRWAGLASTAALLLIGAILCFYREPPA